MQSISVIIVNYNSGPFLSEAVANLKSLPYALEIIVVDNKSSDGSCDGLSEYPDVTILSLETNAGFGSAANIGARRATQPNVLFLNPDCFPTKEALPRMQAWLEAEDQRGACGGLLLDFFGQEQNGGRRRDPTWRLSAGKLVRNIFGTKIFSTFDLSDESLPDAAGLVDAVSGACLMVKKNVHDQLGGFDENFFLHFEDLDYCRRVRGLGRKIGFISDAAFFHYQGASGGISIKQLGLLKAESFLRYMNKYNGLPTVLWKFVKSVLEAVRDLRLVASSVRAVSLAGSSLTRDQVKLVREALTGERSVFLVLGARSDLGEAFCARLSARGIAHVAITRNPESSKSSVRTVWGSEKLLKDFMGAVNLAVDAVVSFCPIWELASYEQYLAAKPCSEVPWVVLSSTSILTKASSLPSLPAGVAGRLKKGEEWVKRMREFARGETLIIRPTILYGGSKNRNVNLIRQLTGATHIKPVVRFATGKRSPVHCDDIAAWVCSRLVGHSGNAVTSASSQLTVSTQGGEEISFAEFISRVAGSNRGMKFCLPFGKAFLKLIVAILRATPQRDQIPSDFVERLSRDFVFDNKASSELGFVAPRKFRP